MSPIRDNTWVRIAVFHPRVRDEVRTWPKAVRLALGEAIYALQQGVVIGMPLARPMPSIAPGVAELRIRDSAGQFRVFYLVRSSSGVLVFHAFIKKTQQTPQHEIVLGRRRLKDMIND